MKLGIQFQGKASQVIVDLIGDNPARRGPNLPVLRVMLKSCTMITIMHFPMLSHEFNDSIPCRSPRREDFELEVVHLGGIVKATLVFQRSEAAFPDTCTPRLLWVNFGNSNLLLGDLVAFHRLLRLLAFPLQVVA
jgi:hypothetical protein